uniref:G-protein coupled receptors family 1 profile domain-containing protein n=1 Tax=Romanomermis culicivorax TaxID=13658 RepID=A0A915I0B4_ROMCU
MYHKRCVDFFPFRSVLPKKANYLESDALEKKVEDTEKLLHLDLLECILKKCSKEVLLGYSMNAEQIIILCFLFSTGTVGTIFNSVFLFLNLAKKNFTLDYCYFVYNLAFINLIYNLNLITLQTAVIVANLDESHVICVLGGYIHMATALAGIVNQAFLAVNRYLLLFNRDLHARFFKSRRLKFLYIFSICLVCSIVELGFWFWNDYGLFNGICCTDFKRIPVWHTMIDFMLPVWFSYLICIFVAYRISVLVKRHTNNRDRMIQSRITEGRSIIKFISFEIGVPLILESPVLISIIFHDFVKVPLVLDTVFTGLFILHTAIDPLVTVTVIKPYRREFLAYYRKIFKRKNKIEPTANVNNNNNNKNNANEHVNTSF